MAIQSSKLRSGALIAAGAAALILSGCASNGGTNTANASSVHCVGVNACKGTSDCKTAGNACKGQNACKTLSNSCKGTSSCKTAGNSCKGQSVCKGHGMKVMSSAAECDAAGGHVEA